MEEIVKSVCRIIWGLPLITILLGVSIYFSFSLRFIQIRSLKQAFKYVIRSNSKKEGVLGDISSFGSLCTALSATLGTGNIVGIAVAISVGGAGTLLWMIISSFFSLSTKYSEGFLAIKYRIVGSDGKIAGGPMYYIEKGFHNKWLAKLFAIFGAGVALIGIGTIAQTNSIAAAAESFGISNYVTAMLLGIIVALVTFGGIHRISDIAEKVIPFMTIIYIGAAIILLISHVDMIIPAIKLIFSEAFSSQAIIGGSVGSSLIYSIQIGISRGIFCHEAGLGSAAIASAAAKTKSPIEQGLMCMMGAFLSIVICLITGLVLIVTAKDTGILSSVYAVETSLTARAFEAGLNIPHLGTNIVNISIFFFAFTTIIGWNYYGEKCVQYVFNTEAISIYRWLFLFFVVIGPFLQIRLAFVIADIVIGLMAIPNVLGLIALRKEIISETIKFLRD